MNFSFALTQILSGGSPLATEAGFPGTELFHQFSCEEWTVSFSHVGLRGSPGGY